MNLGFSETAFLVILGLLLFGPKKLPEIGRHIGRFMAEFKRASAEFQNQLNDEVRQLEREVEETKQTILPPEGATERLESYLMGESSGEHAGETLEANPAPQEPVAVRSEQAEEESPLSRAVTQGPNA
jgi:sec-independent protein translocase protein TatB